MSEPLDFLDFGEASDLPAGKLAEAVHAYQNDRQTGLVRVELPGEEILTLLFVRGQLGTVYSGIDPIKRVDPLEWLVSIKTVSPKASLRMLALTPQDVRIFKIVIEQGEHAQNFCPDGLSLEEQFACWVEYPAPALARVRWRSAGALALFPGKGAVPDYTLFITNTQVLHSAGVAAEIYKWHEKCENFSLYSSEPGSQAWEEYLLHLAFSGLVGSLLGKFEKLLGQILLNQIVRDVNFKAAANDWNVSITASSVNDQAIFSSPGQAGEVYSLLLEVILQHFESVLGSAMLEMLVREAVYRLPAPVRNVMNVYKMITHPGYEDAPVGGK